MLSGTANLLAEDRPLSPPDCNWLTSDDGGGVGGMPRVYFASYKHTRPLDMHFAHGWSPLHFAFLDLQKSQARLTLRAFRNARSGVSSMYSELLFCPVTSGAIRCLVNTWWIRGRIRFLLLSPQREERLKGGKEAEGWSINTRVRLRCTKIVAASLSQCETDWGL